jgi:hypothetical protein
MNKTKLTIAVALVIGGGILVSWRSSIFRSDAAATSTTNQAAAGHLTKIDDASGQPTASAAGPKAPVPDWETRLNRIVNLVGKVPQAELDLELADLAATLPHEDALAVLNLQLLPDADRMPVLAHLGILLLQRWAERAPAEAAQWLARLPDGAFSRVAHRRVAGVWAGADLAAAVAWAEKLPANTSQPAAKLAVAMQAADQKEAVTAIKLISHLPPDAERDGLLNYSARQWATAEREAAASWAAQLPDPALREKILGEIAIDWAVTEPARGAAFAVASVPPGKNQELAVATSVRNWAVLAPAEAAAWVERFPEGALRHAAIESVAEVWAKDDPARAADWLKRLPSSTSRDAAVGMFASTIAASSPEQAARWADSIQSETLRASVRDRLIGR